MKKQSSGAATNRRRQLDYRARLSADGLKVHRIVAPDTPEAAAALRELGQRLIIARQE